MTNKIAIRRPALEEYGEYFGTYIGKVPDGDVVEFLREQQAALPKFFRGLPAEKLNYRYAPEKWSVKQVLGHVIDAEWVFSYRALRFARGDATPLPGFDEKIFAQNSNCGQRPLEALLAEFENLRAANLLLFESFDEAIRDRRGVVFEHAVSVRALLYIIAGHARHHLEFIEENYL